MDFQLNTVRREFVNRLAGILPLLGPERCSCEECGGAPRLPFAATMRRLPQHLTDSPNGDSRKRLPKILPLPGERATAIELGEIWAGFPGFSPSPPLEERVGERRPFARPSLNSMAVEGWGEGELFFNSRVPVLGRGPE